MNFRLAGYALRLRWLWLQRTEDDRAWSELKLPIEPEVRALFDASVFVQISNGSRALFWMDRWINGRSLSEIALGIVATVPSRIKTKRTVAEALHNWHWVQDIRGPRTVQVITEFIRLRGQLNETVLTDTPDRLVWRWTSNGQYCSRSAYAMLHVGKTPMQGASRIWKHWVPLKVKIFMWLATHHRIWTADRRHRHNLDARDTCTLCDQEPETCDHILVNCAFAKVIW